MLNPHIYKRLVRPFLFRMDAEDAHVYAHSLLVKFQKSLPTFLGSSLSHKKNDLKSKLFAFDVNHPIGLAAGFDKNGDLTEVLASLGFGYAEVGSVTARASEGNPKPRLFRLTEDDAVINRLGLNGRGADVVAQSLAARKFSLPVGLNIAKTNDPGITGDAAVQDVLYTFDKIRTLPLAYVTINASCPNTKEGIVTESAHMRDIFVEIQKINAAKLPVLVKLSPDSSPDLIEQMVEAAIACDLSGYVCGNTTTSRESLKTSNERIASFGLGGLSGPPLKRRALQLCLSVAKLKGAEQIIIGCGGIASGQDAYDFLSSGASFLQIYTALVYEGPAVVHVICKELSAILERRQQTLQEAISTAEGVRA